MRYIIITIFILVLNSVTFSQDENIIYKKVIKEYTLKNRQPNTDYSAITLIVLERQNYMRKLEVNEYPRFKEKYKKLDEETFKDFIRNNQEGFHMESDKYTDIDIVMINQEQSRNRKELLHTYPNWNGSILEFSNIGFNKRKNQALLYYGFDSGPGVGGGIYIVFEKKGKKWKSKAVIPAWAA